MASPPLPRSGTGLEPPRKSTELQDPGAHELESSEGEEEHFSDAPEGQRSAARSGQSSPIPKLRVEKVDDQPSHGQIPGSEAFELRKHDAVPDEMEVVPEKPSSIENLEATTDGTHTPGGSAIPRTVVEKVDPGSPSHGEVPGTAAYAQRQADAEPDMVLKTTDPGDLWSPTEGQKRARMPIPETVVTKVDSEPAHGEIPNTKAHDIRQADAAPDVVEHVSGSPTSFQNRSETGDDDRGQSSLNMTTAAIANDITGDDFDDFEEGEEGAADDDFGDFDDGFHDANVTEHTGTSELPELPLPSFPLLNFDELQDFADLIAGTETHLDAIFPDTVGLSSRPPPSPMNLVDKKFPSDRSKALWDQLIVPPPVQPVNWTKSNIRRAFLVSLGVPIDLDEILPASKQTKLVLPSMNLDGSPQQGVGSERATLGSVARLKQKGNDSDASVNSSTSNPKRGGRRRGPPPEPELDLADVRHLSRTTDEKLDGLMDEELTAHVKSLEEVTGKASELLEYWLKRRDAAKGEKEAFEGVIENLVKHARRVRK